MENCFAVVSDPVNNLFGLSLFDGFLKLVNVPGKWPDLKAAQFLINH